jgi:hypothetical protein
MEAVQFVGKESVVEAFGNLGVPNWAIFHGKRLIEKYEGLPGEEPDAVAAGDALSEFLIMLSRSNTSTIYRLCTYEDFKQGNKIKPSTECDRSFNFKLFDPMAGYPSPNTGNYSMMNEINERLKKIEARQAVMEAEENEPAERVSGIGAYFDKLIEIPAVQQRIAQIIGSIVDKILPSSMTNNLPQTAPATMGAVNQDDQVTKINEALQILAQIDSQLGDNLLKVAAIAQSNPNKYFSIIKML